ncbi:hypothetical protein HPC49_28890 [Pyxidicoccus fallax]|uniref:Uncharacterized protein n=1 Tax=Pyxidicoccus fallax TaxID=394095 RepID=A0A848LTX3_9BACT|nr:hypothetical protein [Pyxidicoccus fallax]NMO21121.1 hypothetical protein [Pyxidicoccus fallax]NPC82221.1 hypothetical protein [Pyxidicoccus fallax]
MATPASRVFAEQLFAAFPSLRTRAELFAEREDGPFELTLTLPSPTGTRERDVRVWVEQGVPSLAFGPGWHTHADTWAAWPGESLVDLLRAILEDRFVLSFDVDATPDATPGVIDLRNPTALEDELTAWSAPGRLRLASWGGTADAEVGLEDLTAR